MSEEIGVKEKINNQIEVDKEILSVLPKNNKRNLKLYKEKAAEIKKEYENYLEKVFLEIKRRNLKIKSVVANPKIENMAQKIRNMDKMELLNTDITSFEKMGLDRELYVLRRFYRNDLELVNKAIVACQEKFRMVGIELRADDFNYSPYTKEYMTVFFEEVKKGDISSIRIKDTFEQIYWKCPNIIIYLELNIRSIYLRAEKTIDKYYKEYAKRISKELGLNQEDAREKYNTMQIQLNDIKNKDTALILDDFINGVKVPKDFEETNVNKLYKKILGKNLDEFDKEQISEINKNVLRLQSSLHEYQNYLKFSFIYDEVMANYKTKEKYKTIYSQKISKIKSLESKIINTNKKIEKMEKHIGLINKLFNNNKKLDKINVDVNTQILELKNVYRDLEDNKVKNIIVSALNDGSTIFDTLLLISHFYSYLVHVIIKEFPEITQENIENTVNEFNDFVKSPKNIITNNIKIVEEKDIILMIKDKYNLCGINITREDLEEDNLPGLISTVDTICDNMYVSNCKLKLDDIKFVLQSNKILEENKK